MDDRLKETLSAMMDDEADELSVRRLLSHDSQDDVRSQFQRWQQVRDLIQHGHSAFENVDVSSRVRARLDGQESQQKSPKQTDRTGRPRWQWPAVAMISLAMVVGFGAGAGWDSDAVLQDSVAEDIPELALQELNEQQREKLNRYLLQHAQHNSVGAGRGSIGYARAVSAAGPGY